MFIERRLNTTTRVVELWECDWENVPGQPARKVALAKIRDERTAVVDDPMVTLKQASAICWSYGRTLGNIAVFDQVVLGSFPAEQGADALLPCDIVDAGKFRHGVDRWWCRTHQSHWGTKGDIESYRASGKMTCANRDQKMSYVVSPHTIDMSEFAEVGIWCSMPAAISTWEIRPRVPRIHVHVRPEAGGTKTVDRDFSAIALDYSAKLGMFGADITRVNITPPAAYEFVRGLEDGRSMDCINCSNCGYPHLDLGDFARKPHRKHFCANCGRDSTWSKVEIVSTPLKPLHDTFMTAVGAETPNRTIDLADYEGCNYAMWASTPAVLWTATRPQEVGIHVHVHDGQQRVVDETFGEVILNGRLLKREDLLALMIERTIV